MASNKKDNSNETNDELELFEFKKDLLNLVHVAADVRISSVSSPNGTTFISIPHHQLYPNLTMPFESNSQGYVMEELLNHQLDHHWTKEFLNCVLRYYVYYCIIWTSYLHGFFPLNMFQVFSDQSLFLNALLNLS